MRLFFCNEAPELRESDRFTEKFNLASYLLY